LWHEIATLIPGRKDDQCSKRYNEILGPVAQGRLADWTPEEDEILRKGVEIFGKSWSAISKNWLPNRPPQTCRNRYRTLEKQHASPETSDDITATPNEHDISRADLAGTSPDATPKATSPVALDVHADVNFPDSATLELPELDNVMSGTLGVLTDPELFQAHMDNLPPHQPDAHDFTTGIHTKSGNHLIFSHGATTVPARRADGRVADLNLHGSISRMIPDPSSSAATQLSQAMDPTRPPHNQHLDSVPTDDMTTQAQMRASELAAEQEALADQQFGNEPSYSAPTEHEIERGDPVHNSGNSTVFVHHYHHHHYHHHHYHHHHHTF
jgi:Myb-like DNA-binding protein BAS1